MTDSANSTKINLLKLFLRDSLARAKGIPENKPAARTFNEIDYPIFVAVTLVKNGAEPEAEAKAKAAMADCIEALWQYKQETHPFSYVVDDDPVDEFLLLAKHQNGDQEFAFVRWGYQGRYAGRGEFERLTADALAALPKTAGDMPVFGGREHNLSQTNTNTKRWLRFVFSRLATKGSYVREVAGKCGPVRYLAVSLQKASTIALEAPAQDAEKISSEMPADAGPDSVSGFLGGVELADALCVHPTRRDAFAKQLERNRRVLGADAMTEPANRRQNDPQYLYRASDPKVREIAKRYRDEKPA